MSPRNFARLFLSETGITPAKYVEMARIDKARHYLETSDLSIEMIAEKSGFADSERMRRAFVRELGVNPKNYRNRFDSHYSNDEAAKLNVSLVSKEISRDVASRFFH
jgi:transcriptional regulator GlxA family with amidase domain